MKRKLNILISALVIGLFCASSGIAGQQGKLKIYCGVTMIQAMGEIARKIEEIYQCPRIKIVKGGSGDLVEILLRNKDGDLFFPGSESYIAKLEKRHPGYVLAMAHVGFNTAAIFLKKGNPKGITPSIKGLAGGYKVLLGDPSAGSIGREIKEILEKKGLYDQVMRNAETTDHSKALTQALKTGAADITVNWLAVSTWPENIRFMDAYPIDAKDATPKKLVLAVLKTTNQLELAQHFLDYARTAEGKAIFKKYGLYQE